MHLNSNLSGCFDRKANNSGDDEQGFAAVKEATHRMVFKAREEQEFEEAVKTYRALIESAALAFAEANTKAVPAPLDAKINSQDPPTTDADMEDKVKAADAYKQRMIAVQRMARVKARKMHDYLNL